MHQNSSPAGVDPREGSLGESAISDEPTDRQDSTESAQGSSPHNPDGPAAAPEPPTAPADLNRQLLLYTLARVGLFVVLCAILIVAHVPFVVAPVIAIVVALPLSMVLFRNWSQRVSAGLAARTAARKATRDDLRARLRGEFNADEPDADSEPEDKG